jgi:two-component system phosphate regulon sensor histidine kinase PhoR
MGIITTNGARSGHTPGEAGTVCADYEEALRAAAVVHAIRRVVESGGAESSVEQMARVCLAVVEELTDSRFGLVNRLTDDGLFDTVAVSDTGWDACRLPPDAATTSLRSMPVRGLRGKVVGERRTVIENDVPHTPDYLPPPAGHPPIESFLGVPLWQQGHVIGLLALANRPGGYRQCDGEDVEAVAAVFAEVWARKQSEQALRLDELRLEALARLNQMADEPLQAITGFALEQGVQLTGSRLGYLAFLNEDETVMTMHSWSREALHECAIVDKPLVYPVVTTGLWGEAVRQRKPVITNDYAADNPLKKGCPPGHVKIVRHMNLPVFDAGRIVIVAGVANKTAPYDESDVRQLRLVMQGMWSLLERKRVQETLARRADELTNLNRELETFSYSVSHDLQTPLRSVEGFSRILLQEYAERIDAEGRDYLERICTAADRMKQLISDLLDFSHVARKPVQQQTVQLSALARAIADELRHAQPEREVRFAIQEGLAVSGDAHLLQMVLRHLLENSWKFTSRHARATIEFGRTEVDGRQAFFVRDDGAGFDMAYADKLFGAFQRLHTSNEFPGTGIGLATVQRIIHRHGGTIWAQGKVNEGAVFYFTLG